MEQNIDSAKNVEKTDAPKRQVKLYENDHHLIVGAVASDSKRADEQPATETSPRKKRPRIKRKLDY